VNFREQLSQLLSYRTDSIAPHFAMLKNQILEPFEFKHEWFVPLSVPEEHSWPKPEDDDHMDDAISNVSTRDIIK